MSIRNAGLAIREARLKAGLSQEKLSEGICSVLSLSRIENGAAGVSPSTFQALMAHAGANSAIYPVFASRTDFDCFYTLKHVRFYLDCWQLDSAYEELDKIEEMHWADNKFYYQEWLLLHGKLQFRSGCGSHQDILTLFSDALKITRPAIDLSDFRHLLLSVNEIELLIALAQEFLYTNQPVVCLEICSQIFTYLSNCQLTFFEKNRLLSEYAIVYVKYLIAAYDYITAQNIAEQYRHQAVLDNTDSVLHELTFLTALSQYHCGDVVKAKNSFHYVFFSAHSIESCYSTTCRNYILQNLFNTFPDILPNISILPLKKYHEKKP